MSPGGKRSEPVAIYHQSDEWTFGPVAQLVVLLSVMGALGGVLLVMILKELRRFFARRVKKPRGGQQVGFEEHTLSEELRVKVGTAITVWCVALILSLLLRLIDTPGLSTRLLPTLVMLTLPFLGTYALLYRFVFYPRYLKEARRIDTQNKYRAETKKKTAVKRPQNEKVVLLPSVALIGIAAAPILSYLVMAFIAIPPNVPPQSHDHLLHQFGMPVIALPGYLVGLAVSLGSEMRTTLSWLKPRRM